MAADWLSQMLRHLTSATVTFHVCHAVCLNEVCLMSFVISESFLLLNCCLWSGYDVFNKKYSKVGGGYWCSGVDSSVYKILDGK